MSKGILLAHNSCYVPKFTLFVYQGPNNKEILPIEDFLNSRFNNFEILNLNQTLIQNGVHLGIIEEKICFAEKNVYKEGFLSFKTIFKEIENTIFLKYQVTDDFEQAYNINTLIAELKSIKIEFESSLLTSDQNYKVNNFLRPHSSGVRGDIYTLSNPVEISYELEGKFVKLKNYSNQSLVSSSWNSKIGEENNLVIPIKIKNNIVEIKWNPTLETWELLDDNPNIPKNGNFKVGKGIDKNFDRNNRHEFNKLNRMKFCLNSIKENPFSYGGRTLLDLVNENSSFDTNSDKNINNFSLIKNILRKYDLINFYNRFDENQKKVIEEIFVKNVVILNGEGGSGKTEIAAFLTFVFLLMGKRVLITTETRNALDNILKRISTFSERLTHISSLLNIVRVENRSPSYEKDDLEHWGMSNEIRNLTKNIRNKPKDRLEDEKEKLLKASFKRIFTKPKKLERVVALTYKVVLSSYGLICERDYFFDSVQKFDLNIIEASSSANFSSISTSILNSKKWLFLNDNAQISPLTVGDYLLKQKLRFPNREEIDSAVKFDPKDISLRNRRKFWTYQEYGKGVVSLLSQFKKNDEISFIYLKQQYRINPVLYQVINQAFGNQRSNYSSKKSYDNLEAISELLNIKSHIKYEFMSQEEILDNMGKRLKDLIKSFESNGRFSTPLSIGIACTDVRSLRKVLNVYRNANNCRNSLRKISTNHYFEHRNKLDLTFCSIKSHQEREYDIFILGIVKYRSKEFKKRLYTALTRASNYVIIFGPVIRSIYKNARSLSQKNRKVLYKLEKGSHD